MNTLSKRLIMAIINENHQRISSALWFNTMLSRNVLIAGLGGIGSNVAYSLSRLGLNKVYLMDDDIVTTSNINGQLYSFKDVNKKKANALKDFLNAYSSQSVFALPQRFTPTTNFAWFNYLDAIITGFDNMTARKDAYYRFKYLIKGSKLPILFIDGRMNAEEFQVICLSSLPEDEYRFEKYEKDYLFDDKDAEPTVCSFKQTSFVSQMIGGVITNLFVNFFSNVISSNDDIFIPRSVPFITEYSADSMILSSKD